MQASAVPRDIVSSGSDVSVCEEARDTPAVESDAASGLADEGVHTSRTKMCVMQSDWSLRSCTTVWKKDIVECFCCFAEDRIFLLFVLFLLSNWIYKVLVTFISSLYIFSGPESCFLWVAHDDVCRPVA